MDLHGPSLDLHGAHIDLDINLPHRGLDLHGLSLNGLNIDLSLKKPSIDLHGSQFPGLNALLTAPIDAEINLSKKGGGVYLHGPGLDLHEPHIDLDVNLPHGGLDLHGPILYGQNIDLSLNGPHVDINLPHERFPGFGLNLHGPELNIDAGIDVKPLEVKLEPLNIRSILGVLVDADIVLNRKTLDIPDIKVGAELAKAEKPGLD